MRRNTSLNLHFSRRLVANAVSGCFGSDAVAGRQSQCPLSSVRHPCFCPVLGCITRAFCWEFYFWVYLFKLVVSFGSVSVTMPIPLTLGHQGGQGRGGSKWHFRFRIWWCTLVRVLFFVLCPPIQWTATSTVDILSYSILSVGLSVQVLFLTW